MTRNRKTMAKRLNMLSHQMLTVSAQLHQFSPEDAGQLEGAALMVSEWAEDIMIENP